MRKKQTQIETNMDKQTDNPDVPPPVETETASGTILIDEVEMMRRRVSALARDLSPLELLTTLDVFGLSCKGSNDVLMDRLTRAELRRSVGGRAVEWDSEVDERDGIPRTVTGWQVEPSFDEVIEKVRSGILDNSRNSIEIFPAINKRQENKLPIDNNNRELQIRNRSVNERVLSTGQSIGRFRDPISFSQDENESGAHYMPNLSGNNDQPPLFENIPNPHRNRTPTVTFADGHQLSSSPMIHGNLRRATSSRIMDPTSRRSRSDPMSQPNRMNDELHLQRPRRSESPRKSPPSAMDQQSLNITEGQNT
ncbi:hypothetical protein PV328_007668 [Microctonus aethiopoides]|uniref:Uncharacterized protein n=1 Tax=Microctonus aethiopoides TaxID=144406 RepID=A0AA39C991_9HYME|nr:hypothetical protein PV328_007668 [Microctonus aethiopoides]